MNFFQFITTRQFLKHLAYALLLFIVISWITFTILRLYTRHNEVAVTPNYVGLVMDQIQSLESSKDFELVIVDSIYDYTRIPGSVISQDPVPETKVKPGRTIYLSLVSFVPEQVSMPALTDLSLRRAKALLQTYGLKLGTVRIVPDMAKNAVLKVTVNGKYITPGTSIMKGSVVSLIIGSGSGGNMAAIPFLIGKTHEAVKLELNRMGFVIADESYAIDCDSTTGQVFEQIPEYVYGKRITSGTRFRLTYKSPDKFDFNEYIRNLSIDTVKTESLLP
jgi:beta-lactam-binding protein with PASTA domain